MPAAPNANETSHDVLCVKESPLSKFRPGSDREKRCGLTNEYGVKVRPFPDAVLEAARKTAPGWSRVSTQASFALSLQAARS